MEIKSISNINAHDGRVDKMVLCNDLIKMLVSIGNDGVIQCHDLSNHATSSLLGADDTRNDTSTNSATSENNTSNTSALDAVNAVNVIFHDDRFSLLCCSCDDNNTMNDKNTNTEKKCNTNSNNNTNIPQQETPSSVRLSSICCVYDDPEKAIIAIGTSSGFVFLVKITTHLNLSSSSSSIDASFEKSDSTSSTVNTKHSSVIIEIMDDYILSLQNNPTVHDLDCQISQSNEKKSSEEDNDEGNGRAPHTIIVGHSNGLTLWNTYLLL